MSELVRIATAEITPDIPAILLAQGMDADSGVRDGVARTAEIALRLFAEEAHPRGIMKEIDPKELPPILYGSGHNSSPMLLDLVVPQAHHLALGAVTLGSEISVKIAALCRENEFALAAMLDAAASEGADRASHALEKHFWAQLSGTGDVSPSDEVYCYSPGYCGWHISAQKQLFAYLQPEQIGITLRASFLMDPLKSVSGLLVAGPPEGHRFGEPFPFCHDCQAQFCRPRQIRLGP